MPLQEPTDRLTDQQMDRGLREVTLPIVFFINNLYKVNDVYIRLDNPVNGLAFSLLLMMSEIKVVLFSFESALNIFNTGGVEGTLVISLILEG